MATADQSQAVREIAQVTTDAAIPSLPDDKDYHVIFSYENTDRDWVVKYLCLLEGPPYRLKCCFADRDFLASKDVLGNITDMMQKSMTTIFVISPDHIGSTFCEFETNIAFQMKRENRLRIIPVLRRGEAEVVPIGFRFINYIDARDGVDDELVLQKILRAIRQGPDAVDSILTCNSAQIPSDINGTAVAVMSVNLPGFWWSKSLEDITGIHVEKCQAMGCQIPKSILEDLRCLMDDGSWFKSYRLLRGRPWNFLLSFISTCFGTGVSLLLLMLSVLVFSLPETIFGILLVIGIPCFLIFGAIITVPASRILRARFRRVSLAKAGKISQKLCRPFQALVTVNEGKLAADGPCVEIVKYSVDDCEDFVCSLLRQEGVEGNLELEMASRMVIQAAIPGYLEVLTLQQPKANITRHRVRGDVLCMCQFIQTHRLHLQEHTATNGRSRRNVDSEREPLV